MNCLHFIGDQSDTKSIPLKVRSMTRQRATLLLLTWIYFCRSGGTVNFILPFMTNRDDFNFHITNFPFLGSNKPASPDYGVFISQLIRYARACSSYVCFILRATRLPNASRTGIRQGKLETVIEKVLCSIRGSYQTIQSSSLTNAKCSLTKYNDNPTRIRLYTNP